MTERPISKLDEFVAKALAHLPKARDYYDREIQRLTQTKGKTLYDISRGKGLNPGSAKLKVLADVLGQPSDLLARAVAGESVSPVAHQFAASPPANGNTLEDLAAEHGIILLEEVDLALGMGATYLDANPEVLGVAPFREDWLRGLHKGPLSRLKVVRGRGDSMQPTILDGDIVLIDTSHRRIDDQDRIWAIAYGELGMIRRVRVTPRGTWMLMPDNAVVRPDEVGDGEASVIGRVIWIGRQI